MNWLSSHEHFVDKDLDDFYFDTKSQFTVQTVRIHISEKNSPIFDSQILTSEASYLNWINSYRPSDDGGPPTILLAMHTRLPNRVASSVPYGKEALKDACKGLLQHKSLSLTMPRKSHAVFNTRPVVWSDHKSFGPSIVYNCRSDTICQTPDENDILMSVTTFPDIPLTFAVMYGCTDDVMEYVSGYLEVFKRTSFHPLMFPMMFVELERTRLLAALRRETSSLDQRIMEMKSRLSNTPQENGKNEKDSVANETILDKDCKATKDWLLVSKLQNGVHSLLTILDCIKAHSMEFLKEPVTDKAPVDNWMGNTRKFQDRLAEMEIELRSEVRKCDSLLGGMSLATQMVSKSNHNPRAVYLAIWPLSFLITAEQEWNYHTRRDAKANIIIACASKMDSNQMRLISVLGMIFLPGTFLATFFSMTFFKWIPEEGAQIISPWIGLYCGAAAMLTVLMLWLSKKYFAAGKQDAYKQIRSALDSDDESFLAG
ncbi:hypothetical protein PG988_005715 [Apiospora saccharicola]